MEVAARELLPALRDAAPSVRFTAFLNRETAEADGPWQDIESVTVPVHAENRVEWVRGEQLLLPGAAQRAGCDLVHSLGSTGPARGRFTRVVTVHDVIYKHFPEAHFGLRSLGMRALVPLAARRSHRVIADSGATRDDLVELLSIPSEKIDVVPLAARPPRVDPAPEVELRARYDLGDRPLVLSTSAKRPHKNLLRLLDAHALLTEPRPLLVLPGYPTEHEGELRQEAARLGITHDVRFLGWLAEDEVEGLLQAATCVAFPSLFEGFGLPVLEGMLRGVPVVCSARSSLAEVAGDAAMLVDPESPRSIADGIAAVLRDPELARDLVARGREQAARFSWEATAAGCLETYERALAEAPTRRALLRR
ncbi:MAG: glycosyltransferase family 4 protein [Solirubrobacteraceae bacterium]|nr:glycosyltransferase family 4 protein [Solirubrobacteraceae bacterium]